MNISKVKYFSIIIFLLASFSCSSTPKSEMPNPLPDCPSSPNCARLSFELPSDIENLHAATKIALTVRKASQVLEIDDGFDAVFTIPVFGWKDDVHIRFESINDSNTTLHIRSASREGYYDIGVNKRRVRKLMRTILREIKN